MVDFRWLADNLKGYLWSWVSDLCQRWIYAIAATYSYVNQISRDFWSEINQLWREVWSIQSDLYTYVQEAVADVTEVMKIYAENLVNNVIYTFDKSITDIWNDILGLHTWIDNSSSWFSNRFNTMQNRVVDWITDRFEDILDRIFGE